MDKDDFYGVASLSLSLIALLGMDWNVVKGRIPVPRMNRKSILFFSAILGSLVFSAIEWRTNSQMRRSIGQMRQENASLSSRPVSPFPTNFPKSQQEVNTILEPLWKRWDDAHPGGPNAHSPEGIKWANETMIAEGLPILLVGMGEYIRPMIGTNANNADIRGNYLHNSAPVGIVANGIGNQIIGNTQNNYVNPSPK